MSNFQVVRRKNGARVRGVYEREGRFYARIKDPVSGRWRWVASPENTPDGAARIVKEAAAAVGTARAERFVAAVEGSKRNHPWARAGAMIEAYRVAAAGERALTGVPRLVTEQDAVAALRMILEQSGAGLDAGTGDLPEIARKWAEQALADGRNRTTVATVARSARSVFGRRVRQRMARAGCLLPPDLGDRWPKVFVAADKYALPDKALRDATLAAGKKLLEARDDLWLAYALAYYAGMAAADVAAARWDWIRDGRVFYARQKTGRRADPPLPESVAAVLTGWTERGDRETVLPGTERQRRDLVQVKLAKWMRGIGWTTGKCAHELRKLAGSEWATSCGIQWAARWLGDDEATAARFYVDMLPEAAPTPARPE
jgi:hypothetical protein